MGSGAKPFKEMVNAVEFPNCRESINEGKRQFILDEIEIRFLPETAFDGPNDLICQVPILKDHQ
jgi:hypothetical protein